MLQTDSSALGVRNDHSSTVKKPSLGNKSQLGKSGNQHRRPSGGPQPPQKVRKGQKVPGHITYGKNLSKDLVLAFLAKFNRMLKLWKNYLLLTMSVFVRNMF